MLYQLCASVCVCVCVCVCVFPVGEFGTLTNDHTHNASMMQWRKGGEVGEGFLEPL